MEVTRILDLRQFDRFGRRFRDLVYKNSSRLPDEAATPDGHGGFSVFETSCACGTLTDACVCQHIKQFYDTVAPQPCAFWTFDTDSFIPKPPNKEKIKAPEIVSVPSDTGDHCHRNVHNISDNRLGKAFRRPETEHGLRLCFDGHAEAFTADRAIELLHHHFPDPE